MTESDKPRFPFTSLPVSGTISVFTEGTEKIRRVDVLLDGTCPLCHATFVECPLTAVIFHLMGHE